MYEMTENVIHQLFLSLGVNLDYVPQTEFECFTMALQFLAGGGFMLWFVKMMYALLKSVLTGGLH